jgi:broad specificity phosphatase PhoE
MKTLHFVRHGEADYNVLDRVNAHPQIQNNLTLTGREQAACCRQALSETTTKIEIIYCSEFPRTQQTAHIINQHFNAPLIIDPRINETGAFAFEGKPVHLWHGANVPDRCSAIIPGCEPLSEMKQRLADFLEFLRSIPENHIAVVSHAEPIQIMAGLLQGQTDSAALQRPVSHCLPIRIEIAGIGSAR